MLWLWWRCRDVVAMFCCSHQQGFGNWSFSPVSSSSLSMRVQCSANCAVWRQKNISNKTNVQPEGGILTSLKSRPVSQLISALSHMFQQLDIKNHYIISNSLNFLRRFNWLCWLGCGWNSSHCPVSKSFRGFFSRVSGVNWVSSQTETQTCQSNKQNIFIWIMFHEQQKILEISRKERRFN